MTGCEESLTTFLCVYIILHQSACKSVNTVDKGWLTKFWCQQVTVFLTHSQSSQL